MKENEKNPVTKDWETEDEFYQQDQENKAMSLEDFMEEDSEAEESFGKSDMAELEEAAKEIRQILTLSGQGKGTKEIAEALGLSFEYVSEAQICAQSFPEDDALAIARLLIMG